MPKGKSVKVDSKCVIEVLKGTRFTTRAEAKRALKKSIDACSTRPKRRRKRR